MGKPAARTTDMHICPMVTPGLPPIPHVGGPIIGPGCPTVLIGGLPASVVGDMCICVGPPDSIILGSTGVFIGGMPAARMGDSCAHGGTIAAGFPTVLIGETGTGEAEPVTANPAVVSMLEQYVSNSSSISSVEDHVSYAGSVERFDRKKISKNTLACLVIDEDGRPMAGVRYEIILPAGKKLTGATPDDGQIHIEGLDPGSCEIRFPDMHKEEWKKT